MKPIDIGLIQARLKRLEADAAAETQRFQVVMAEHERDVDLHARRMAEIETELEDLRTAERVFAKLTQENRQASRRSPT
jgi:hypothetical protein